MRQKLIEKLIQKAIHIEICGKTSHIKNESHNQYKVGMLKNKSTPEYRAQKAKKAIDNDIVYDHKIRSLHHIKQKQTLFKKILRLFRN